jgi:hypothetical protein
VQSDERTEAIIWTHEGVRRHDGVVINTAHVRCAQLEIDTRVELRLHNASRRDVDRTLTPFLPIASVVAWVTNRPMFMDGCVDGVALRGAEQGAALLAGEDRLITARRIKTVRATRRSSKIGIWFSRGVDSLSALYENFDEVGVLLGLEFIDPPYANEPQRAIWAETVKAAERVGKPLWHLSTNARTLLDPLAGWDFTHSSVFSSLGLLCAPRLKEAWLAGGHRESTSQFQPSNRNDVQQSWSSRHMAIGQPPGETRRNMKAAIVAKQPVAQAFLRVCWEADRPLNCGVCLKCLMTMTNFAFTGQLEPVSTRFESALSLAQIKSLELADKGVGSILLLDDMIEEMPPSELRTAWEIARSTHPKEAHELRTTYYL